MSEENNGFIDGVVGVLSKPEETFQNITENHLMKGIIIITCTAFLAAVSSFGYMSKIPLEVLFSGLGSVDLSQIPGNMGMIQALSVAISVLIGWILSSLIYHGLSFLVGGTGSIKRFFAIQGYTQVPILIKQIIRTIDAFTISGEDAVTYYLANRDISNKLLESLLQMNLLNVFGIASLVLVVYGISVNYGLSKTKSVFIAIVPSVLLFALSYFT